MSEETKEGNGGNLPAVIDTMRLPELSGVERDLKQIRDFQQKVKALMVDKHDYGVIPGTDKPTLLKPGAEKLVKIFKCRPHYTVLDKVRDFEHKFFSYMYKCEIIHIESGQLIDEGMGSCNSEEGKYKWRWVFGSDVPEHIDKSTLLKRTKKNRKTGQDYTTYRIENEDIASQDNTIMKMAKKRALVDAALSLGSLSDIFTQDLEDLVDTHEVEDSPSIPTPKEQVKHDKPTEYQEQKSSSAMIEQLKKMVDKKLQGDWSMILKEYDWKSKEEAFLMLTIAQGNSILKWLSTMKG